MSWDPRQRPQMPQWGQQPMQHPQGGWGQNSPWLQQLAQRFQAQQAAQRGPAVGPGMPGAGGVPQPMPPGPGLQPQNGMPPQGGQFAANPALMQALAQRTQQAQLPVNQGFAAPQGRSGVTAGPNNNTLAGPDPDEKNRY